ncbi:MAG: hypothetical protein CLLPBCKN_007863 [Chroococcidiopsis cubana SAG 39.79]|nr:GUN4 N-terminal ARM-like repeat domain-containing protein [Chroococcidiopsis cubana]MDZ4878428.1 hypothetical protein [Chroococcidiopsis cubana SAG 39.79]
MTNPTTTSDTPIDFLLSACSFRLDRKSSTATDSTASNTRRARFRSVDGILLQRRDRLPTWIDGKIYQILYHSKFSPARELLQTHFPAGIVTLRSQSNIDYSSLQQLLIEETSKQQTA